MPAESIAVRFVFAIALTAAVTADIARSAEPTSSSCAVRLIAELDSGEFGLFSELHFLPKVEKLLVAAGESPERVVEYDVRSGSSKVLGTTPPDMVIDQFLYSPDGQSLAIVLNPMTSGNSGMLELRSSSTFEVLEVREFSNAESIERAEYFPDGSRIAALMSFPSFGPYGPIYSRISLFDSATISPSPWQSISGYCSSIDVSRRGLIAYSAIVDDPKSRYRGGRHLANEKLREYVYLAGPGRKSEPRSLLEIRDDDDVDELRFNPDGTHLAVVQSNREFNRSKHRKQVETIGYLDIRTGKVQWQLSRESTFDDEDHVDCVAFSPCGTLLIFTGWRHPSIDSSGDLLPGHGNITFVNTGTGRVVASVRTPYPILWATLHVDRPLIAGSCKQRRVPREDDWRFINDEAILPEKHKLFVWDYGDILKLVK